MPKPSDKKRNFWLDQRVVVTGGAGFLGSFLVEELRVRDAGEIVIPRSAEYDLRNEGHIIRLLKETKPTLIIHLAAICGGIGANQAEPGRFFYDNAIMGIQLMEQARVAGVKKFVQVGTVCAYPKFAKVPFKETDLWSGYPEETNAPYGLAKKMLLVQAQAYRLQYGFNGIYLLPANLYGPRDNFDLKTSHVIPAMVRKFVEAKTSGMPSVKLWGTGQASRDFFYVEDAAEGILAAAELYDKADPINLGTGEEIKIKDLAGMIREITGYKGDIVWDPSRPDGQPRRMLDTSLAKKEFGFEARTPLRKGLQKTIQWYSSRLLSPSDA